MTSRPPTDHSEWPEALATVTACLYDIGAGRALAFGLPTSKHFRISYNYFADDEIHTGQFNSTKAVPQGSLFPIRYNPDAPHQNSHDTSNATQNSRAPLLTIGVIGSLILTTAWFLVFRGCH